MAVRQRGGSWQADFTVPGQPRQRKDGFATQGEAEAWVHTAKAALLLGKALPNAPTKLDRDITLSALLDLCLNDPEVWKGSKGERTAEINGNAVVNALGPRLTAREVTTQLVATMTLDFVALGNGNGTINRKRSALLVMLKRARDLGYITELPKMKRLEESKGRVRFITPAEEAKIITLFRVWGKQDEADLTCFLVDTGARLGEALRLTWPDVGQKGASFWDTKGGEGNARTVPLTARTRAVLEARRKAGHEQPFGLNPHSLRNSWDRMRGHLKLHDVVIHTLRHTCASRLVQGGVDLRRVQTWMGHKDIKMTMRYAHLAPGDLDRCLSVLEGGQSVTHSVTG